jgi:hypothetical protein
MLSSTSADAKTTVEVVLLEEVDQVFASVQNAWDPSTNSAEMIDGNGECPSEVSRIDLKQRAAATKGTMRPTRILLVKLVIPVVRLVATDPNVPVPAPEGGTGAGPPEKSPGIVAEKTAGRVSRSAPQNNHLKNPPPAS